MNETKVFNYLDKDFYSEIKNVLDLSLIDHEFIVAMLNLILEEKEKQNGLQRN